MLPTSEIFKSSLSYFALVFGAGCLCGSVRVPLLQPLLGDRHAQLVEMPIMFLAIWKSSHMIVNRLQNQNGNGTTSTAFERLMIGIGASVVLLAVEMGLHAMTKGWNGFGNWVSDRDPVAGAFYFGLIGVMVFLPSLFS
jgi:hypothetical protein